MKYRHFIIPVLFITFFFLPAAASSKTCVVTDQLGRKVVIPDNIRCIVSLAPSITEILFALDQGDCVKGATRFSDFPVEATKLPKVGTYVHLDLEKIVALKPDLCIGIKDGNPREVVERLEALKIPVYVVDPRNLETVMDTILEIGGLLSADQRAKFLVQDMQSRIQRVKSVVAKASHRPRVFFQIGIAPIVSVGTQTFIHRLIVLAGGENLTAGPVPYPRFSKEQVLVLSPEVFIITSMARGEIFERVKAEWSKWPDLPAIKNGRMAGFARH